MKRKYLSLLLLLLVISSASIAQKCVVEGHISGLANDTLKAIFLPCRLGSDKIISGTIVCHEGKFRYPVNLKENIMHVVHIKQADWIISDCTEKKYIQPDITFFIRPEETIIIKAKKTGNQVDYSLTGSKLCKQKNKHQKMIRPFVHQVRTIIAEGQKEQNKIILKKLESQIDSITLAYIQEYPGWEYSAELLAGFPNDTISKYYPSFSERVKNSFFGKYISQYVSPDKTKQVRY